MPAGRPSTVTSPPSTCCTPTMARISVLLPHPLGPSRPVTRRVRHPEGEVLQHGAPSARHVQAVHHNRVHRLHLWSK